MIVITPFLRSRCCLMAADEPCHLSGFSKHDRPLCSSPWDLQPCTVPIQMGIKVQFYFTVLSSLPQIFSDSVFWLLNWPVLSNWSKTSVWGVESNTERILQLSSKGVEEMSTKILGDRRKLLDKWVPYSTCIFPLKVLPTAMQTRKSCFQIFKAAFLLISILSFVRLTFSNVNLHMGMFNLKDADPSGNF